MIIINRGWLKIYLFYGTIFFLLGLTGYTLSNHTITRYLKKYEALSGKYIQSIKDYSLAKDFGFGNEDEVVAVTAKQFDPSILLVYSPGLASKDPEILKEIQIKITANLKKVKIMEFTGNEKWRKALENLYLQNNIHRKNLILIGVDLSKTANQGPYKMTLILPDFLARSLAYRISSSGTELSPEIIFEEHAQRTWQVLDYTWEEGGGDAEDHYIPSGALKTIDLLIQILQQDFSEGVKV